jgi:hypothetical protein
MTVHSSLQAPNALLHPTRYSRLRRLSRAVNFNVRASIGRAKCGLANYDRSFMQLQCCGTLMKDARGGLIERTFP